MFGRVDDAATFPAERETEPQHHGQADYPGRFPRLRDRSACNAASRLYAYLVEAFDKQAPVLGIANGVDRSAEDTHAVPLEYAALGQRQPAVEGRLAAERKQNRVDLLVDDDALDELGQHRDKISPVRHIAARL